MKDLFHVTRKARVYQGQGKVLQREQSEDGQDMGKKLYCGNLSYSVTSDELKQLFAAYGTVQSADVIMDRDTGRAKGFGFVEMSTEEEAKAAIAALNGKDNGGRALTVNEAKPKTDRGGGGGGGGRARW